MGQFGGKETAKEVCFSSVYSEWEGIYRLRPRSIRRRTHRTVLYSIGDGKRKELRSDSSCILVHDGKCSEGKTAVANAVPVTIDACPPAVSGGTGVGQETVVKTEVGDRPANSFKLVRGPSVVEPVIRNGERGSQLGSVEEVGGIPVITSITPRSGPVARGILPTQVSSLASSTSLFSSNAHLEFFPSAIDPLSVVGREVRVTEVLDPELDFTGGVENTRVGWATVIDMDNDGRIKEHGSIGHNGIVPSLEIWVILHQVWQGGQLVGRGDQPRVAGPKRGQ